MVGQVTQSGVVVQGGNSGKLGAAPAANPVPEVKKTKNTYRQDPEMGAMVKVDHILKSMEPAAANRVLNWVTAKVQERGRAALSAQMETKGLGRLPDAPHPAESF